MRNSLCEREEEREATPWPESILILVNINRLGSVTSTHGHLTRRLLIKSHQRQKYRMNNNKITNKMLGGLLHLESCCRKKQIQENNVAVRTLISNQTRKTCSEYMVCILSNA